ncbi:MAG TPA: DNA alkylation repair protein [Anaerolineaceae bacterium]|nr:DNA alkylation repair protein [Anaerolineaceae bacterium]
MTRTVTYEELVDRLQALANTENAAGQQRFGIRGENLLGISIYDLRKLAAGIRDHELAQRLWDSGVHEARLLASMVDDPAQVTRAQMDAWAADFDSWDVCDQVCDNLFAHVAGILQVIPTWAVREEEFVRRAAFSTMAVLAWYDPLATDEQVEAFFPLIQRYADDSRNFVKKAVNWALRNIGKKRGSLRAQAVACAKELAKSEIPSARWIGKDALKEFATKFGPL